MSSTAVPAPVYILGQGMPLRGAQAGVEKEPSYSLPEHPVLASAQVLIGGKAQLALLASHPAEKLLIGADTQALYRRIKKNRDAGRIQVVLCTGDPLFYGLGARLAEHFQEEPGALRILPGVSVLQAAAAYLALPWEDARSVSLHGRDDFFPLAHALISGKPVLVLTDAQNDSAVVASWMRERGRTAYKMHILDTLFHTAEGEIAVESYSALSIDEAASGTPDSSLALAQRVLFLEPQAQQPGWPFGLQDNSITCENSLLTKWPVRAAGLAALGIEPWHTVWDLGAGSGSVSIEAARLAYQGRVFAVERKPERAACIAENRKQFGAANLEIVQDDLSGCLPPEAFAETSAASVALPLPCPDRIFIGGGLGGSPQQAEGILRRSYAALALEGKLLVHCVLLSSLELARAVLLSLGAALSVSYLHSSTSTPLAKDIRLEALNPVFLVLAVKKPLPPYRVAPQTTE